MFGSVALPLEEKVEWFYKVVSVAGLLKVSVTTHGLWSKGGEAENYQES